MSVGFSAECVGCGSCAEVCPGSLIRVCEGRATILRPERCWGCCSCLKACPVQAVSLHLAPDIGGLGGQMTVRQEGSLLHWRVTKPDGSAIELAVDSREANHY